MKILTIVGARPQFVKAAVLSRVISGVDEVTEVIVHTGQHFDANMSDIFFDQMKIPKPNYQLDINGMGHGEMTGNMLIEIEKVLIKEKPDWVLVYGDTNSTLAGALAASKLHIKLAHVEAGLRSFNMLMPEEVNRTMTDRISNLLFCPSPNAMENLEKEGIDSWTNSQAVMSGDIMFDAVLFYKENAIKPEGVDVSKNNFVLATLHRAENTNSEERLREIVEGLNELNKKLPVVLPLHPRTKNLLQKYGLNLDVKLIEPVGYHEMLWLIQNSKLVITDSGGLQKEAYFCEKFCVTMRDETEWIELVNLGANKLVGASKENLLKAATEFLELNEFSFPGDIYGDGEAGKKILNHLMKNN